MCSGPIRRRRPGSHPCGTPSAPTWRPSPPARLPRPARPPHAATGTAAAPAAAVKELAAAERTAADTYTALLADAPGELARLLASVAAACAAHAYLLTELAKETPA